MDRLIVFFFQMIMCQNAAFTLKLIAKRLPKNANSQVLAQTMKTCTATVSPNIQSFVPLQPSDSPPRPDSIVLILCGLVVVDLCLCFMNLNVRMFRRLSGALSTK